MSTNLASILIPYKTISYESLKEEQKMCVEFANEMRMLTFGGDFPYVWYHIPNEFLPSARKNFVFDLKQKHMGKISGVPDYCFMSSRDGFFIEFKALKGKKSKNQEVFESWCASTKVDYFLCRSAKDGISLIYDRLKRINNSQ
jgi:hypothetical protein